MKIIFLSSFVIYFFAACTERKVYHNNGVIIANGQMPDVCKDKHNNIHVVYGSGDSIMYTYSSDKGNTFFKPVLISVLAGSYSFAMRGPQITAAENTIVVTACTSSGNIYSFYKEEGTSWMQSQKVNDADTVAKEGLMDLSADGNNVFAAWLDLRGNNKNKIYGAKSTDRGKTWLKNMLVYASPDSTVCECCKPSAAIKGNKVYVMFRNWVQGNRDLYLAQSNDGGYTFTQAQKLGYGNWKLNGCPMDGGSFTINDKDEVQTVWKREAKVYAAIPGMHEKEIGEGRGCTIETVNNKNVYAWAENGNVVFIKPGGKKQIIGEGNQPVLKTINNDHLLCIWESNKQIHAAILEL